MTAGGVPVPAGPKAHALSSSPRHLKKPGSLPGQRPTSRSSTIVNCLPSALCRCVAFSAALSVAAAADSVPRPLAAESLRPVPKTAVLRDPDWHIWGASMLRTADGVCHLFVARWPKARTFDAWVSHSEIAYATSSDPLGPYTIHRRLFGGGPELNPHDWDAVAHNVHALESDGRYYLFYTGNTADGDWWRHRNAQRIGVAFADHPAGPWTRLDRPIVDVTPGSWDHQIANCPIVTRGPDGRFFLVYKGVADGQQPFGGNVRMGLAIADHPLGPWVKQPGTFFDAPGVKFPSDDNFVWAQDGWFHAIIKDYGGHFQDRFKEALVLFRSRTARSWEPVSGDPVLTPFRIAWADGTVMPKVARLDQPPLWRNARGEPAVLFLAVKETGDKNNNDVSYNIHVPLAAPPR